MNGEYFFIIYGVSTCKYCILAENLIREHIDTRIDKKKICIYFDKLDNNLAKLNKLKHQYSWSTTPIVVVVNNDFKQFIGGYDELVKYFDDEKEKNKSNKHRTNQKSAKFNKRS